MKTLRCIMMTVALSGTAFACGEYDDPFDTALSFDGPVTTASSLVWVEPAARQLLFATPGEGALELTRTSVGDERNRVAWIRPTVSGEQLLVLVVPRSAKEEDVQDRLFVYSGDGSEELARYDLPAPYSSVTLSPDGHWAVLHFDAQVPGDLLHNANQVALLELTTGGLRSFSLAGFGGRLDEVQFPAQNGRPGSPTVRIGSATREIVAFLAEGEVVLVDALDDAPEPQQVAVRLPAELNFVPSATLLRPGDDELYVNPAVFLRSQVASDVVMLTLVERPGSSRFTAQVSLLPVGTAATDFVLHDGADVPYLVTLDAYQQRIVFTDIRTQQGFSVALEGDAQALFVRTDTSSPARSQPQLVAWGRGGNAIHTLGLDGIDDALGQRPEHLDIRRSIGELVQLDNDRVLVGSGTTLYVVDFPANQVSPLTAQAVLDPRSSAIEDDRLVLGTPSQEWISAVDLVSLNPESMLLDAVIGSFHYLRASGKVAVVHPDTSGYVTVVEAFEPSRSTAYSTWGVFFADALEREEQDP